MTLITGEEQIGQLQISHQKLCETSERSGTPFLKYQKERTAPSENKYNDFIALYSSKVVV